MLGKYPGSAVAGLYKVSLTRKKSKAQLLPDYTANKMLKLFHYTMNSLASVASGRDSSSLCLDSYIAYSAKVEVSTPIYLHLNIDQTLKDSILTFHERQMVLGFLL